MTYVKWYMQNIKTISKQPNYILIIIFIIIFSNIKNNLVKVNPAITSTYSYYKLATTENRGH